MSFTKEDELSDTQVAELRDVFFKFDADRSGTVAFEHVDEILRTASRVITDPEFKKLVKSTVPADLEKKVQFPEFMDMVSKYTRAFNPAGDLHDAFRVFDRDGHGFITTAELRHVVTTLGERMTEEEADELIREADTHNEGHVDYEEFIKTISKPLPPGEYGVPPRKKEPAPPIEVVQASKESDSSPTSAVPAEVPTGTVSEAPPAGEVPAEAAAAEMSEKSGPTSAPAESSERPSEGAAGESGQGSKSSGKGSVSGSGKRSDGGSGSGSGKASGSGSGKGSGKTTRSGSGSASKKSSRKSSGGAEGGNAAGPTGPLVEVVVHDPPAEKTSSKIEKR